MLILLSNINALNDTNFSISTLYQLIKFTISNISASYTICGFIIVMCMFATTLRNLIYKVLNLAVMSVFVVALWAHMTDVTFIYIVYILAFVSAVVMLFLSVVLMLPSSAIAVSKRNFSIVLFSVVGTPDASLASTIYDIAKSSLLILLLVCFVYSFMRSWRFSNLREQPAANSKYKDFYRPGYYSAWLVFRMKYGVLNFASRIQNYRLYGTWNARLSPEEMRDIMTEWENIIAPLQNFYLSLAVFRTRIALSNFVGRLRNFYLYRKWTPIFPADYIRWQVAYWKRKNEFLKALPYNKIIKVPGFVPRPIARHLSKAAAWAWARVIPYGKAIFRVVCRNFLSTFYVHPALLAKLASDRDTVIARRFIIAALYTIKDTRSRLKLIINFITFIVSDALRAIKNIMFSVAILLVGPTNVELLSQAVSGSSVFFIAVPVGPATGGWSTFTYSPYLVDAGVSKTLENLAAIQQGLYVDQPMLLLVSITGLLVALIGAPFFVSKSK